MTTPPAAVAAGVKRKRLARNHSAAPIAARPTSPPVITRVRGVIQPCSKACLKKSSPASASTRPPTAAAPRTPIQRSHSIRGRSTGGRGLFTGRGGGAVGTGPSVDAGGAGLGSGGSTGSAGAVGAGAGAAAAGCSLRKTSGARAAGDAGFSSTGARSRYRRSSAFSAAFRRRSKSRSLPVRRRAIRARMGASTTATASARATSVRNSSMDSSGVRRASPEPLSRDRGQKATPLPRIRSTSVAY